MPLPRFVSPAHQQVLEDRLGRLLSTLGLTYGQDEEQAVAALMNKLTELGENPTQIAREAARKVPKWRLSDVERRAAGVDD